MPKIKESLLSRAQKLIGSNESFEVQTRNSEVTIFCKYCTAKIKIDAIHMKSQFESHIKSQKHKEDARTNLMQPSISCALTNTSVGNDSYTVRLTSAFLEAGIPLWKLRHPSIRNFFLDEHQEVLPSVSTLYSKIEVVYNRTVQQIKANIGENPIFFIIDE